ncbi:MAG: glutaredoxin family protein [Peptococcaceae bacterium]|nr:MAG: glutaredoxin family protein [Peptococcaceae bacterium]
MKQFLTEKAIPYEFVDVDMLRGAEQEQVLAEVDRVAGKRSFPITVANGRVIQGYKPDEVMGALQDEK